jgi:hypothetical protein
VTLITAPDINSSFSGWSGDAGCGSVVMLNAGLNCVAIFTSNAPPPSQSTPPSNCFIATAAHGSDMAEDVMTLRRFRDGTLMRWTAGREFVRLYYRHSPPLADYIRERDALRATVRWGLWPLVLAIRHPALVIASALVMLLLVPGWRRARRSRAEPACLSDP